MRPLKLTMTAFGSYANETAVDFTEFENGLYLITGDTGSGKTTIFDGIMFALYEQASGNSGASGNSTRALVGDFRNFEMMHSDYADTFAETTVKLDFEHSGKKYTIVRTCKPTKSRKDGTVSGIKTSAYMTGEGMDALEKSTDVTEKVTELLNMNADQFRKIVMLAQGEFSRFLSAGSDVKKQILGDLFGDSEYKYYQELLKGAKKKIADRRAEYEERISSELGRLTFDEEKPAEEMILYDQGRPELVKDLEELVRADEKRLEAIEDKRRKALREKSDLDSKKGKADLQNRALDALKDLRDHMTVLEGQKERISRQKDRLGTFENAWDYVRPALGKVSEAKDRLAEAEAGKKDVEGQIRASEAELKAAEETVRANSGKKTRISDLDAEIRKINDSEGDYRELKKALDERTVCDGEILRSDERKKKAQEIIKSCEEKIGSIGKELADLSDASAEKVNAEHDAKVAGEKLIRLTGEGGIEEKIGKVTSGYAELEDLDSELVKLTAAAADAQKTYTDLYTAFISGQAGLLAEEVGKALETEGKTTCPVCGSTLIKGEHVHLAERMQDTPDREQVDAASEYAGLAEEDRAKKYNEISVKKNSLDNEKTAALERFRELEPSCGSWEDLSDEKYFSDIKETYTRAKEAADRAVIDAAGRLSRQDELNRDLKKANEDLDSAGRTVDAEDGIINTKNAISEGLRSKIQVLTGKLPYPTFDEAEHHRAELTKEREELQNDVDRGEKVLELAGKRHSTLEGNLEQINGSIPGLAEAVSRCAADVDAQLNRYGFADVKAVEDVLAYCGETEGRTWISMQKSEIQRFENELENTGGQIEKKTAETREYRRTDLSELEEQLEEAAGAYELADAELSSFGSIVKEHRDILTKVREAKEQLRSTERVWKIAESLGSLAEGVNSEDGKWDFDTYVMGAMFEEVLAMANQRLTVMSGGQYELQHEAVGKVRRNSAAGMEISVMDMTTGKNRNSSSLSGGEKFLTSLSLALGLSDAVQSHTGGIALESLFIDEGFGTLDDTMLDKAVCVLDQLADRKRQVGIISHVSKLEGSISQKIIVKKNDRGSYISIVR